MLKISAKILLQISLMFYTFESTDAEAKTKMLKTNLSSIKYEGFADEGRIEMTIDEEGVVQIKYENHSMVLTKNKPWKKTRQTSKSEVSKLFSLVKDPNFLKEESLTELMPDKT